MRARRAKIERRFTKLVASNLISLSREMSDEDDDEGDEEGGDLASPLTAGLEKRAISELRGILAANSAQAYFDLFVGAGLKGVVAAIEHDEGLAEGADDAAQNRALKAVVKLLTAAGKRLDPVQNVPGSNADERVLRLRDVYDLLNKSLAASRSRATEHAIKLAAAADLGLGSPGRKAKEPQRSGGKKRKKESSDESDSSDDSSDKRSKRKRSKAQMERRAEEQETRGLHAVYEAVHGLSEGAVMMAARVPARTSRLQFTAALEESRPTLPNLRDLKDLAYETTELPDAGVEPTGTPLALLVVMMHIKCVLDHIALAHAVDLSTKYYKHIKPRPCDRVDLSVSPPKAGKPEEVITHIGVRPDRLERLEFALWAAALEHRVTDIALAAMWVRIYKRAAHLMQQNGSTITHAVDTLLCEADLFRPVPSAGSSSSGAASSSARFAADSAAGGKGPRERALCNDFQAGRCRRGADCRYAHASALRSSEGSRGVARSDRERDRERPRSDREPERERSASRGHSPSRSPDRGRELGREHGGDGRSRGAGRNRVGFFSSK